jgi:hypothetical protein
MVHGGRQEEGGAKAWRGRRPTVGAPFCGLLRLWLAQRALLAALAACGRAVPCTGAHSCGRMCPLSWTPAAGTHTRTRTCDNFC